MPRRPQYCLLATAMALALVMPSFLQAQDARGASLVGGLSYRQVGSGAPLLVVHGFGGCAATLPALIDSFSTVYQVIAPDLPGHGGSTRPSGRFTFKKAGAALNRFLDSLQIEHISAVGVSAGAQSLLQAAVQRPTRFDHLVLVSGGTILDSTGKRILQGTESLDDLPAEVRTAWEGCIQQPGQLDWLLRQFRSFPAYPADLHISPVRLNTIKAKVLLIGGDRDPLFGVDNLAAMHGAMPSSALWIIPNGGHVPIFGERLASFLSEARSFLAAP